MDVLKVEPAGQPFGYDPETTSFVVFGNTIANRKLLVGYGFAGRDMVIGEEGRNSWEAATGRAFAGGEDGTYSIIAQTGSTIRIETDHAGHMPVFYYQDGQVAAASNSIIRLAEHLRATGVQVRPNPAEVVARGTDFFPLHQLATFETAVAGVFMLPAGCELEIQGGQCIVKRLPRREPKSYIEDLKAFISIWRDRIATLLDSGLFRVSVDLSGGLDSRMVFSLFHMVMRDAPLEWIERISIYSHGFLSTLDPKIAEEVLQVSENDLPHGLRWQRSFSAFPSSGLCPLPMRDPLRLWWVRCGGIYSPNYLSSVQADPGMVLFGGGGGEGFRDFYGKFFPTQQLFAAACTRRIGLSDQAEWLREGILSSLSTLHDVAGEGSNPMALHYREFRGRLHGGLRSRSRISLMPIASGLLETATRSLSSDAMDQGQVFHDVIGNCAPLIVGVRFDQDKKTATHDIRSRYVNCGLGALEVQPGMVYGRPVTTTSNFVKVDGLRQLADAVESAGQMSYVQEIWGAEAIQQATAMSAKAALEGRFPHPNPASLVSGILMAGTFY